MQLSLPVARGSLVEQVVPIQHIPLKVNDFADALRWNTFAAKDGSCGILTKFQTQFVASLHLNHVDDVIIFRRWSSCHGHIFIGSWFRECTSRPVQYSMHSLGSLMPKYTCFRRWPLTGPPVKMPFLKIESRLPLLPEWKTWVASFGVISHSTSPSTAAS